MFCPICGQQQISENTRFCSRCGFLLTGISDVIANNGIVPLQSAQTLVKSSDSPRKRGVKKGAWIMLVGMLLVVPLLAMLHIATNTEPILMAIAAIIGFFGGILRMVYALMFEDPAPQIISQKEIANAVNPHLFAATDLRSLPPQQSIPAAGYAPPRAGAWKDTNDLAVQPSVIDSTTKLLQKED